MYMNEISCEQSRLSKSNDQDTKRCDHEGHSTTKGLTTHVFNEIRITNKSRDEMHKYYALYRLALQCH